MSSEKRGSKQQRVPPPPPPPPPLASPAMSMSDVTLSDAINDEPSFSPFSSPDANPDARRDSSTSLFEYSDTSEDASRRAGVGDASAYSGAALPPASKSRFRFLNESLSKSMRLVRFSASQEDEDDDEDEEDPLPQRHEYHQHQHQHHHHHPHHPLRQEQQKKKSSWMTQLAYSFRSPQVPPPHHKRVSSYALQEYPHTTSTRRPHNVDDLQQETKNDADRQNHAHESSPLLPTVLKSKVFPGLKKKSASQQREETLHSKRFIVMAAAFLQDYEANRPPSLSTDLEDITDGQLRLHQIKFTDHFFPVLLGLATLALFVSSGLEGWYVTARQRTRLTILNFFALTVLGVDLWIRHELKLRVRRTGPSSSASPPPSSSLSSRRNQDPHARTSRSERLVQPLILFGIVLGLENLLRLAVTRDDSRFVLFSSIFKPLVFFYISSQARDALEALRRIIRIVIRVLVVELLLILMFAAVACRLFGGYEQFYNLSTGWLSLFELSTTVVNPSIWMPMYRASKYSAFFFVFYIVTAVFYLHSLVLSVVFQTYIQAASEIHERSLSDREDAIHLAYLALKEQQQHDRVVGRSNNNHNNAIDMNLVRETLQLVRPHYSALKINALVEIVDPSNQRCVDYPSFRTKIRQALNASIRTARNASTFAMSVELIAVVVAVVNFIYVILVSSAFNGEWFNKVQEIVGCLITLVAGLELLVRFNPLRIADFTPLTRLNATFDGLALVGAVISGVGIILFIVGRPGALEFILMGRAIDMIRVMRFFRLCRDIVRRSADVFPALIGPIILVMTTLHVFVYLGMGLWGGAVDVGVHEGEITYLYDLNNFNSYHEGVVTMFQVLVVNDWHAIAEVFLYADRCENPYIVYPFFIIGNLIGVSIMLNVLTAFFVETFVTKLDDSTVEGTAETTTTVQKERGFNIKTSENTSVRRISSTGNLRNLAHDNGSDASADADSEGSSESEELYEFDVYEREGFDKIMQTVAGSSQNQSDFARQVCNCFEIFECLSPGRETVGYLVCDQQTLERFGNRRFQTIAEGFLEVNELHAVVSDMHAELLALSARDSFQNRSLIRTFTHRLDSTMKLEISASLLRRHPALSLFVSQTKKLNSECT